MYVERSGDTDQNNQPKQPENQKGAVGDIIFGLGAIASGYGLLHIPVGVTQGIGVAAILGGLYRVLKGIHKLGYNRGISEAKAYYNIPDTIQGRRTPTSNGK